MPIKTLGSLGKIRVGRVTGNTHIFFFGLRRLKVTYKFMALGTRLVVLFDCCATADILTILLQQCFLFFIVVVIPGQ